MAGQLIPEYPTHTKRNGCINCGSPKRLNTVNGPEQLYAFDQVVDEIVDLDGNIHSAMSVVLCETCIIEIAHLVGCVTPSEARRLQGLVNEAEAKARRFEEALRTRTDRLVKALHNA